METQKTLGDSSVKIQMEIIYNQYKLPQSIDMKWWEKMFWKLNAELQLKRLAKITK